MDLGPPSPEENRDAAAPQGATSKAGQSAVMPGSRQQPLPGPQRAALPKWIAVVWSQRPGRCGGTSKGGQGPRRDLGTHC